MTMAWLECDTCEAQTGDTLGELDVRPGSSCPNCPEGTLREVTCCCPEHCRVCGCGDFHACEDGCSWVEDPIGDGPLCSACLPKVQEALAQLHLDLATLEALDLVARVVYDDGSPSAWVPTPRGLGYQPTDLIDVGGLNTGFTP